MSKNIKELATEFSVSKQAISKLLTKSFRGKYVTTKKVNGTNQLVVSEDGYSVLKRHYINDFRQQPTSHKKSVQVDSLKNHVKLQTKELDEKNKQIRNKDEQIKTMQKLLDFILNNYN